VIVLEPTGGRCRRELGCPIEVGLWVPVREGDGEWWCVVPDAPSDLLRRCGSKDSPLGEALLGHVAGDVVEALSAEASWPVLIVAVEPELRSKSSW
jgi:hypothetical protein